MMNRTIRYSQDLPELRLPAKEVFRKNGKLKRSFYEAQMVKLHLEVVKLQQWILQHNQRFLAIFEGIDTAGKSSTIKEINRYLNPRKSRMIALPKPTQKERAQWYFQRHIAQFPADSEMVFFDRSWYNRAGIEMVFGFCTPKEHEHFYSQVNRLEEIIVDEGVWFFKLYLTISRKTQRKRIKDRENNPLKRWKLSKLDYESLKHYKTYITLRDKMFALTGTPYAPWVEFQADDKKRARLNLIRYILDQIPYEGKDADLICGVDKTCVKLHQKGGFYGNDNDLA